MAKKNKRNETKVESATDRDQVLATLRAAGVPLTREELAERLEVRARQRDSAF